MAPQGQKRARLDEGDEGTEAEVDNGGAAAFSKAVVQNLVCPITHQLFVDPYIAEDGHMYEKAAISNWLESKKRSPLTNENMGTTLVKSPPMTRALIESAIERKIVDAAAASTWHLECAKVEAIKPRSPGSQILSIKEHLRRAEEILSTSEEIKVMRDATVLRSEMDDWVLKMQARTEDLEKKQQALLEKSPETVSEAVAAILESEQKISESQELREKKSVIRIIDDAEEFERLCKESVLCSWDDEMERFCGRVFIVQSDHGNICDIDDGSACNLTWSIPIDACSLVAY